MQNKQFVIHGDIEQRFVQAFSLTTFGDQSALATNEKCTFPAAGLVVR
jgi:hypothetical protein